MGQVKSEKGTASTIATGIVSASNSITTAGTVTRDKTSYYTANTVGRKLIINEASIAQNIQSKISEFVKLIHGVANEFEVVDENISTMWQNRRVKIRGQQVYLRHTQIRHLFLKIICLRSEDGKN